MSKQWLVYYQDWIRYSSRGLFNR